MGRMSRIWSFGAAIAVVGALLLPASGAVGAPSAHKSGALINYLTTGKLRIGKRIIVPFQCSVNCNVVSFLKLKGPFVKGSDTEQGSLTGRCAGGPLHQAERDTPQAVEGLAWAIQDRQQSDRHRSGDRRDRPDRARLQAQEVVLSACQLPRGARSTAPCRS